MPKKNRNQKPKGNHRGPTEKPQRNSDDQLLTHVERAAQKSSRQPDRDTYHNIWHGTLSMVNEMGPMPPFDRHSIHQLDEWCIKCLMKESFLSGFVAKIVSAQAKQ